MRRPRARSFPAFAVLFLGAILPILPVLARPASAASGPPPVEVVKVDGVIDRPVADYLVGTLEDAEREGATVVVQLSTPGMLDVDAVALAERIFDARVPVVVWVGPPGSHAAGGGLLLVYASGLAMTSPGSGIGPLQPLDLATTAEDPAVRDRALAAVRRWAGARGRDPSFATADAEAPGAEVLRRHVVEGFASSIGELLEKVDGRRVPASDGAVRLFTDPKRVPLRFHELGPARRILHAVASPVAIYVLLVLGIAGIAFELTQTGLGVAGISGVVAVGLGVYGLVVVPFSPLGLALFLGGQALLTADVLLRRLGVLSAAGLGAFVAGSVLVFGRVAPAIDVPLWLVVGAAVSAALYYGFGLTVAIKSRERLTQTQRGLVGLVGETRGELSPEGPVFVKGALWRGRSSNGPIPAGTKVRVRRVDGLILRVEPEGPDEAS